MKILYGVEGHYKDVTEIARANLKYQCLCMNNIPYLRIPPRASGRDQIFGDPLPGVLKHIRVNGVKQKEKGIIYINLQIQESNSPAKTIRTRLGSYNPKLALNEQLEIIHGLLSLNNASIKDKVDLQLSLLNLLKSDSKVIFFGTKESGLPALLLASILEKDANLTVYESELEYLNRIKEDRDLNEFSFEVFQGNVDLSTLTNPDLKRFDIMITPRNSQLLEIDGYERIILNEDYQLFLRSTSSSSASSSYSSASSSSFSSSSSSDPSSSTT